MVFETTESFSHLKKMLYQQNLQKLGATYIREISKNIITGASKMHLGIAILTSSKTVGLSRKGIRHIYPNLIIILTESTQDIILTESEVYKIKRSYRQNKYNTQLTNIISQLKLVSSQHYYHYYLMIWGCSGSTIHYTYAWEYKKSRSWCVSLSRPIY